MTINIIYTSSTLNILKYYGFVFFLKTQHSAGYCRLEDMLVLRLFFSDPKNYKSVSFLVVKAQVSKSLL